MGISGLASTHFRSRDRGDAETEILALRLSLVWRLQHLCQLDRDFHLLDYHDNRTTFERDGTRCGRSA